MAAGRETARGKVIEEVIATVTKAGPGLGAVKVCLGGTFHPFHIGHEALLRHAMAGAEELFVGVTDGGLSERDRAVPPWQERAQTVESFLRGAGYAGNLELKALTDGVGPAVSGDYDAIAVSPETLPAAQRINVARTESGRPPLDIRVAPHVLASDLLPVSATRVHAGDVDRSGQRLTPVRVAVGSANPVKVAGVEAGLRRVLPGLDLDVRGQAVASDVPEQPQEAENLAGARSRAVAALAAWPEAEYAVGVEAGLNRDPDGEAWYDVQACVVRDRRGTETTGWGPAFQHPAWVTERALAGEMISDILGPVADDPRIGGTTGAIGFLTDGRMDRTELTAVAVLMAFVPRIRADVYARPVTPSA